MPATDQIPVQHQIPPTAGNSIPASDIDQDACSAVDQFQTLEYMPGAWDHSHRQTAHDTGYPGVPFLPCLPPADSSPSWQQTIPDGSATLEDSSWHFDYTAAGTIDCAGPASSFVLHT